MLTTWFAGAHAVSHQRSKAKWLHVTLRQTGTTTMTNKPKTIGSDLAHLPPALKPLSITAHWLLWLWEFASRELDQAAL